MNLQYPLALLIIPIALIPIALSYVKPAMPPSHKRALLLTLRVLTVSFLALAFASPITTTDKKQDSLLALVDISDSVSDDAGQAMLSKSEGLANDLGVPLTILPFGKTTAPAPQPASSSFREIRRGWQQLDSGASNLEQAAQRATSFGANAVVINSDGYETEGSTESLFMFGSTAHYYPITPGKSAIGGDAQGMSISQLTAPLVAPSQKSVDIRVSLFNSTTKERTGTLTVRHGTKELMKYPVTVPAGKEELVVVTSDPSQEGLNEITAELQWNDESGPHSSQRSIWLSGEKRDKVLLINGTSDDARLLPTILKNQAYTLQSWLAGSSDSEVKSLTEYQAIILNNTPRNQLPAKFESEIEPYLTAGGRLVTIGGNRAFGLGGYIGSRMEPLFPVRLVPPTTEKKRLNVAVQLVIDKSRSMATDNRLDYAKEAAVQVVRNLKDDDYIGVIGFAEQPFIVQPMDQVGNVRELVVDRVKRLFPNLKTELFPALNDARRELLRINAGRKHIIVLTDGRIPDAGEVYLNLVRQLKPLGITLSTILVGADEDGGFLGTLAAIGGGKFYQDSDPRNLPSLFLTDVRVATGERTIKESTLQAVRPGPDKIELTELREFPALRGYVETLQRDDASTQLIVYAEQKASPLLASIPIGKGISIAYTSDANGRWSSEWMRWTGIYEFWSDLIEKGSKNRTENKKRYSFDLRSWVERGEVQLGLTVFNELQSESILAAITLPTGTEKNLTFTKVKPGYYTAKLANGSAGKYQAAISIGGTPLPPVAWTLSGELFGERRYPNPNMPLLSNLAQLSGGTLNPTADDIRPHLRSITARTSHSEKCLLLALLTMLIELLVRLFIVNRRVGVKVRA